MSKTRLIADSAVYTNGSNVQGSDITVDGIDNTVIGNISGVSLGASSASNTLIGYNNGNNITDGTGNVSVGSSNLTDASDTSIINNIALGTNILKGAMTSAATNNIGIGFSVLNTLTTGYNNIAIGDNALLNPSSHHDNIAIGQDTILNPKANQNIAIGTQALRNASYAGSCVAIGFQSLNTNTSASGNVAVGNGSLQFLTGGSAQAHNTSIGDGALQYLQNGSIASSMLNCSGLGYNSAVSGDNQIQLGDSSTTTYVYGTVQNRSDLRDKADVKDTELGLDFINSLRPVDYKWDFRSDYQYDEEQIVPAHTETFVNDLGIEETVEVEEKTIIAKVQGDRDGSKKRSRFHHGFIAQEVAELNLTLTDGFGGYQDHALNGGNEVKSLGYDEFIAPLVKAVQELTERINILEGKK